MPEAAAPSPAVFLDSLPPWASDLVRAVTAKQANTFVLHGVPADLVPVRAPPGCASSRSTSSSPMSSSPAGPRSSPTTVPRDWASPTRRRARTSRSGCARYDSVHGTTWADGLPRDAANCFALLDSYFRHCASQQPCRPVVLLLPFAETVVPAAEVAYRTPEDRAVLVYLRKWSQDPVLLAKNIVIVMVTETLSELDPKLLRSHSTRESRDRPPRSGRAAGLPRSRALARVVRRGCPTCRRPASPS